MLCPACNIHPINGDCDCMKPSHFITPRTLAQCHFTSGAHGTPRQLVDAGFNVGEMQALTSRHNTLQARQVERGDHLADFVIACLFVLFIGLVAADIIPLPF